MNYGLGSQTSRSELLDRTQDFHLLKKQVAENCGDHTGWDPRTLCGETLGALLATPMRQGVSQARPSRASQLLLLLREKSSSQLPPLLWEKSSSQLTQLTPLLRGLSS